MNGLTLAPARSECTHNPIGMPTRDGTSPMTSRTGVFERAGPTGSMSPYLASYRPGVFTLLMLSAWCGLVSGLLEVGIIILRKHTYDINHLYWMSRHFIWLNPLVNLAIFVVVGVVLSIAGLMWRRRGRWLATRLSGALTLLPPIWAASPSVVRSGRVPPGSGLRRTLGPDARAACRSLSAAGPRQFSRRHRSRARSGAIALGRGPAEGVARGGTAAAAGGFAEHPLDRPGHGGEQNT